MHPSYKPKESGTFTGSIRLARPGPQKIFGKPLKNGIPDISLADPLRIKREIPDFDPRLEFKYSQRELILLAEKILLKDPKPVKSNPQILLGTHLRSRQKREIFVGSGIPEPHVVKGMYWRTHPNGRKVSTDSQRAKGDSYYA